MSALTLKVIIDGFVGDPERAARQIYDLLAERGYMVTAVASTPDDTGRMPPVSEHEAET